MNMLAGLIGYMSFIVAISTVSIVGLYKGDNLETWARKKFFR